MTAPYVFATNTSGLPLASSHNLTAISGWRQSHANGLSVNTNSLVFLTKPGIYQATAGCSFPFEPAGSRGVAINVGGVNYAFQQAAAAPTTPTQVTVSALVLVTGPINVEAVFQQDSGGSMNPYNLTFNVLLVD